MIPCTLRSLKPLPFVVTLLAGLTTLTHAWAIQPAPGCLQEAVEQYLENAERNAGLPEYRTNGSFLRATPEQVEALSKKYRTQGIVHDIGGKISRVTQADLALDLNTLDSAARKTLSEEGMKNLSKVYYFTSGAGLWSRGGGEVKALIPYNLKETLSPTEFSRAMRDIEILETSDPKTILMLAEQKMTAPSAQKTIDIKKAASTYKTGLLDDEDELVQGLEQELTPQQVGDLAAQTLRERKIELTKLINKAQQSPLALNPIDLKIATVAVQGKKAKTYIPFDIWTSEQTHSSIRGYLESFARDFPKKKFHPNPEIDAKIKKAISEYLEESEKRGETHLFGYQIGYPALSPQTGKPLANTAAIGEGAGMAKSYLDSSGRTAELQKIGKTDWIFENIEVNTDLALALGAHRKTKTPVSVILVPEKPGYKGGSPFIVERNGKRNLELHEMSAIPAENATGNPYFNSNTLLQSLSISPTTRVGFEVKNAGQSKIIRAKVNAGDITQETPTSGIGGRIGEEYENFKTLSEFSDNGDAFVKASQKRLERDVE